MGSVSVPVTPPASVENRDALALPGGEVRMDAVFHDPKGAALGQDLHRWGLGTAHRGWGTRDKAEEGTVATLSDLQRTQSSNLPEMAGT
jgi:hypothetical protein